VRAAELLEIDLETEMKSYPRKERGSRRWDRTRMRTERELEVYTCHRA